MAKKLRLMQREWPPNRDWKFEIGVFCLCNGIYFVSGILLFHWFHFGSFRRSLTEKAIVSLVFTVGILYVSLWFRARDKANKTDSSTGASPRGQQ
jgi:uncharacterized membrane protein SirB2